MNNKIIASLALTISATSVAEPLTAQEITEWLSSPPYIGVSFSMGEGVQFPVPEEWFKELSYDTIAFLENQK